MEDWRMLRDRELDVEWMLNRDSVRSKARWVALQGSPLQTIASVQPREAEYLAEPYLPRGMITILAGHAGQGKTTLALWLASHVSNGDLMPGGKPATSTISLPKTTKASCCAPAWKPWTPGWTGSWSCGPMPAS